MKQKPKFLIYLEELRAPFFTGSIVPIVLGSIVAWNQTGSFHWGFFFLTLLGVMALHAGANVANDYYDHKSGDDPANTEYVRPFTGGSRLIQEGRLTPKEVMSESLILYAIAVIIGLFLAWKCGIWVLIFGVIGVLSGFFYTAPPFRLVHRGIGEIFIGLNFGILSTVGAYYVQTSRLAWEPVIIAIPVAILITMILFINEFQDARADASVGKNHWVVRLGKRRAAEVYTLMVSLVYLSVVIAVLMQAIPAWTLLLLLSVPIAINAISVAHKFHDDSQKLTPANASTILLHLLGGVLLSIGYVIDKLFG
jgi:1,4-dihydroxy-2-naphthoate octaprenyltransferase